jgi:hypothetical protein
VRRLHIGSFYIGSFQKRSILPPRRKLLPSGGGGGEKKLFLIIVNVLGHPKWVGGLTSYFRHGGGMDIFWNDPFRNFNNNILQSYVLNNKHRHSTNVCDEPNHINIAMLRIYVLNIIVSHEKLSRSEKSTLYDTDLERAIISFIYQSFEVGCRRSQNVCVYI